MFSLASPFVQYILMLHQYTNNDNQQYIKELKKIIEKDKEKPSEKPAAEKKDKKKQYNF